MIKITLFILDESVFACLQIYPGKRRVDKEFNVSSFIPSRQRMEGEVTYAYALLTFPVPTLPVLPTSSNLSASTAAAPSEKQTSVASINPASSAAAALPLIQALSENQIT